MAEHVSEQLALVESIPPRLPGANASHGRLRLAYWSFVTPAGGVAVEDSVRLVRLPRGARVVGGRFSADAMSTGAEAASVSIGVAGDTGRFLETTSVDTATSGGFADGPGRDFGAVMNEETELVAHASVEAWAGGKVFSGVVLYAVD